MNDKSKELATFILGAALGLVVGYFLASDKKEDLLDDIKEKAHQMKEDLEDQLEKGKALLMDLSAMGADVAEKL
ncbi:MAG: YtxH domain-containing protein [Chitinophagaceae bacterium]